jgi:hypothetical protein
MKFHHVAALLLALSSLRAESPIDQPAATVNGITIPLSEVNELVRPLEVQIERNLPSDERPKKIAEIRLHALNDLIDRQLLIQEFHQRKMSITLRQIVGETEAMAWEQDGKRFSPRPENPQDLRAEAESRLMRRAFLTLDSKDIPKITEEQIAAFYQDHRHEWTVNDEVKLRMLKLNADDPETKRQLILHSREKIVSGRNLSDFAFLYSDDSTQGKSGDWGWVKRGQLGYSFEKIVFALPKGKLSDIVTIDGAYYLLLAEDRKEGEIKPLKEVRSDIEAHLQKEERDKQLRGFVDDLRKKADIKIY